MIATLTTAHDLTTVINFTTVDDLVIHRVSVPILYVGVKRPSVNPTAAAHATLCITRYELMHDTMLNLHDMHV